MAKNRLTKKQMQVDGLEHAIEDARDYLSSHKSQSLKTTLIAAAIAVVGFGVWGIVSWRANSLAGRLSEALALLDAPLVTDGTAAPGQRVFKSEAERRSEVVKELQYLLKDAPSSDSGRAAGAILLSMSGTAPSQAALEAVKAFAKSDNGSVAAAAAALSVIDAEAASGKVKEAIATGKGYLEAANPPLPKDVILFTLASLYEKNGQASEAKTQYQRLVSDYPESALRSDAQQKLTGL